MRQTPFADATNDRAEKYAGHNRSCMTYTTSCPLNFAHRRRRLAILFRGRSRGLLRMTWGMRGSARLILIGYIAGLSGIACLHAFVGFALHLFVRLVSLQL